MGILFFSLMTRFRGQNLKMPCKAHPCKQVRKKTLNTYTEKSWFWPPYHRFSQLGTDACQNNKSMGSLIGTSV